ncbi:ATP-binding cassette subfamily C protein [Rhizobium azooxidifex]|uniref:ATP-binding cassette subfamily C protein n=1 Tax=Mycoplana azooxidifex TaxID=1636188 RepID=A0A7W6D3A7_9HYPH|nr:ATP-binding cassette subfamily C protein [Mycoplana azooxidifex]
MAISAGNGGADELRAALKGSAQAFLAMGFFSFFVNLLVLTGPLFMLQIYDRVLASRSEATLVALTGLIVGLFAIMGVLDHIRARLAARVGAKFQARFDKRVFNAVLDRTGLNARGISTLTGMRDLDAIQKVLSSPAVFTVFDIPWTPFFLFVIFMFHPWMGLLGVAGGLVLVALTWLNQNGTKGDQERAMVAGRQSDEMTQTLQKESDTVRALGMRRSVAARWQVLRDRALEANIRYSDSNGFYAISSKTFRVFLQSAILALGAYLVLQNEISAGAMIASSIIIGRALAPIEGAIGQWSLVQRAFQGWRQLSELLSKVPEEESRTALPKPRAILELNQVTAIPPGEKVATLRMLSLELGPGQALGVIGQSASGKSTLARILTGIWPPAGGNARLDGASLEQYGFDGLAEHVGYLPQDVVLFEGTVAENIARMQVNPDAEKVVAAAKKAGAHDMILRLPDGYDTRLPANGGRLSGGQKQRVGLARALFGDPVLVVLDEPNSNLDAEGSMALNLAIRNLKAEDKSVVIMAHRPAAIEECDLILILENGQRLAFGPRDEVLRAHLRNHAQVVSGTGTAGSNK